MSFKAHLSFHLIMYVVSADTTFVPSMSLDRKLLYIPNTRVTRPGAGVQPAFLPRAAPALDRGAGVAPGLTLLSSAEGLSDQLQDHGGGGGRREMRISDRDGVEEGSCPPTPVTARGDGAAGTRSTSTRNHEHRLSPVQRTGPGMLTS